LLAECRAQIAHDGRSQANRSGRQLITYIDGLVAAVLSNGSSQAPDAADPDSRHLLVEPLSERELEVLRLIAGGASNHAIASALVISIGTVKSHINHILGKLAAVNRTEAVSRARSLGLLTI
jgi:ATP/maltotriose-dependent transcriptional regulator MalT